MRIAITKPVSASIERCELTHLKREPIDINLAREQHRSYEICLAELGCRVQELPEEPDLPDAVFIEDTAVVLEEVGIITRPGAKSRRAETNATANALVPYRELVYIQPPGTLDGGDVLWMGKRVFVGLSERSNQSGIDQLRAYTAPYGYKVTALTVQGCLHLKSAATRVDENCLLVNPEWVDRSLFGEVDVVEVHPDEPMAANALLVGDVLVYPKTYPQTSARLEKRGFLVMPVDVSELQKAEGGVTCCSLIFSV